MENIISIVEEFFLPKKRLQIYVRKNKVIISRQLFYSIILNIENSDKIRIYPIWKIGLFGKIFFYKVFQEQINNYNGIKDEFIRNGYDLSELHIVGNFG